MDDSKPAAASRYIEVADGCFRDPERIHRGAVGALEVLEWTPTLNDGERATFAEAKELAEKCTLAGGGWRLPDPHELQGLIDYSICEPASTAPDTKPTWYWTGTVDASSPSVFAWVVDFYYGGVGWYNQSGLGLVRACRRVPARQ